MTDRDPFGRPVQRPEQTPPAPPAGGGTPPDRRAPSAHDQLSSGVGADGAPRWQYEIEAEAKAGRSAERRERLRNIGGPVGIGLLAIWKVGRIVLVALGKVALLFKIPLLGTVLSGLISIGAYAVFFGWPFAIGLVGSLLVHELGHVVQIRREGMPVKALNFVPFLGAYVLSDAPRDPEQQSRISIAGPLAGSLLAVGIYAIADGDELLEAVAYTGFFLNLLNLLPVPLLDGGGVGQVFNAGWWLLVAGAVGLVALATSGAFAAIVAISGLLMAFLHRSDGFRLDAGEIAIADRAKAAVLYVGVIAVCAVGMEASFRDRHDELIDRYGAVPAQVDHAAAAVPVRVTG